MKTTQVWQWAISAAAPTTGKSLSKDIRTIGQSTAKDNNDNKKFLVLLLSCVAPICHNQIIISFNFIYSQ